MLRASQLAFYKAGSEIHAAFGRWQAGLGLCLPITYCFFKDKKTVFPVNELALSMRSEAALYLTLILYLHQGFACWSETGGSYIPQAGPKSAV